jgi:predicted nucleic acid-binding protein
MLNVVSNTTPILSLLKIGKLDLLKALYGTISIPQAVYRELMAGKDKEFYTDLSKIDWIKTGKIHSENARLYLFDLDDGEAETLILAQEQQADLVIIDEKCGRRYAKQMNIPITGTIGILLKAKEKGLIDTIEPILKELIAKNSWLSSGLISKALHMADEIENSAG